MAFPLYPANGDTYYRSDLGLSFFYTGTIWVSVNEYSAEIGGENISATGVLGRFALRSSFNTFLTRYAFTYFVSTTCDLSNYWVASLQDSPSGATISAPGTTTPASPNLWLSNDVDYPTGSFVTASNLRVSLTKTGTPGNLYAYCAIYYRVVAN